MMSPRIITRIRMFERPATARIPKTESTHKTKSTEATACSGRGKILIAHPITRRIRISHKVTGWLLMVTITKFGIEIPVIGVYPRNQRIMSMITIAIIIIYCVSRSFGVIG